MNYLLIFLGAGAGGVCRYLMGTAVQSLGNGFDFPIGTFAVNMLGCLLIGFLSEIAAFAGWFSPELRLLLFVGVLGGFTTFSSFGLETVQLIRSGQYLYAALNAVLQTALGLGFVWLGLILARLVGVR